jgi:hypothetical protein
LSSERLDKASGHSRDKNDCWWTFPTEYWGRAAAGRAAEHETLPRVACTPFAGRYPRP